MDIATAIALFGFALVVGAYGTIIGAGGGFVLVPGLVVLFGFEGVEAVGTATLVLTVIGLNGARVFDQDGLVDRPAAGWFALTSAPVALLCGWLVADRLDAELFLGIMGLLLVGLAVLVLIPQKRPRQEHSSQPPTMMLLPGGAAVGAVSGTFAVGAGLLTVPIMRSIRRLGPHRAAATTAAAGIAGSVAGAVGHSLAGNPVWSKVPPLLIGALVGSSVGARAAGRLSARVMTGLLVTGLLGAAIPLLLSLL